MGNKGEDTGKMGLTSKEKNIFFSKNVTFFKQKDRLLSKIKYCNYITHFETKQVSKMVRNVISCV